MQIDKVLITGVAGFIGSNLLDFLLLETSWKITGVDDFSTGRKANIEHNIDDDRFTFLEMSCFEVKSLKEYDCIFHLAALPRIQPSFSQISEHINANLSLSIHLIELMIKENHYPKFIYSGSSAIYGTPVNVPTKEDERIDCLSPYAFQKYEVEKYLDLITTRYPLNYVTLRYFNPYGERSFNPENRFNAYSSVVGIFLDQKENNKLLTITGDGSQMRDFIHVYDVASANLMAAQSEDYINTSFNIGHGETISILELAEMISSKYQFIQKREGEADITHADISKAKALLGWVPTHKLEEYIDSQKE